jgi:O-6-methylguanine DNA methyltransferase
VSAVSAMDAVGATETVVELACVGVVTFVAHGDALLGVALRGGMRPPVFRLVSPAPTSAFACDLVERLRAYDRGDDPRFDEVRLAAAPSPFQGRVREALRATAPGATLSYGDLAARAGSPRAARAVGGAMARNRFPLLVPCHRVLSGGGALGGFTGGEGLLTKRALLAHERKAWGHAP